MTRRVLARPRTRIRTPYSPSHPGPPTLNPRPGRANRSHTCARSRTRARPCARIRACARPPHPPGTLVSSESRRYGPGPPGPPVLCAAARRRTGSLAG